jgi:hypothetical protein
MSITIRQAQPDDVETVSSILVEFSTLMHHGRGCEPYMSGLVLSTTATGKSDPTTIFYGEFDGRRKKRVLVKIIGE